MYIDYLMSFTLLCNIETVLYLPIFNTFVGPTPLHLAAKCGALDSTSCLLANCANILAVDDEGWAPIHHAAYYDHEPIIRCFIRKNEALLELQTKNE